jgi:hypothetical protein
MSRTMEGSGDYVDIAAVTLVLSGLLRGHRRAEGGREQRRVPRSVRDAFGFDVEIISARDEAR